MKGGGSCVCKYVCVDRWVGGVRGGEGETER